MKSPGGFRIGADLAPFAVCLACEFKIVFDVVAEVVWLHEIPSGVVRRVDVDELDLA